MTSPEPRAMPRRAALAGMAGLALGLAGCGSVTTSLSGSARASGTPAAAPTRLQLVVTPHPDDEMEGWSQVDPSDDVHTMRLTMTRGEATSRCDPKTHAAELDVAAAEVAWAVRAVLGQRGTLLPDLPLERVVCAAYVGAPPDAVYQHPDHRAVQAALLDPALNAALAPPRGARA